MLLYDSPDYSAEFKVNAWGMSYLARYKSPTLFIRVVINNGQIIAYGRSPYQDFGSGKGNESQLATYSHTGSLNTSTFKFENSGNWLYLYVDGIKATFVSKDTGHSMSINSTGIAAAGWIGTGPLTGFTTLGASGTFTDYKVSSTAIIQFEIMDKSIAAGNYVLDFSPCTLEPVSVSAFPAFSFTASTGDGTCTYDPDDTGGTGQFIKITGDENGNARTLPSGGITQA